MEEKGGGLEGPPISCWRRVNPALSTSIIKITAGFLPRFKFFVGYWKCIKFDASIAQTLMITICCKAYSHRVTRPLRLLYPIGNSGSSNYVTLFMSM